MERQFLMKFYLLFLIIASYQLLGQTVRSSESLWDQIRLNSNLQYDSDRLEIKKDEKIEEKLIRFRTLGCYPLTGAVESKASSIEEIIIELLESKHSEREGRLIDSDQIGSMEIKKQDGYF